MNRTLLSDQRRMLAVYEQAYPDDWPEVVIDAFGHPCACALCDAHPVVSRERPPRRAA